MAEYIDIDEKITVTDTRGRERETTVRNILEMNKGVYTAADVRPVVRARWIDTDNYYQRWKCSACGCHTRDAAPDFCPNCGAEMRPEPPKDE